MTTDHNAKGKRPLSFRKAFGSSTSDAAGEQQQQHHGGDDHSKHSWMGSQKSSSLRHSKLASSAKKLLSRSEHSMESSFKSVSKKLHWGGSHRNGDVAASPRDSIDAASIRSSDSSLSSKIPRLVGTSPQKRFLWNDSDDITEDGGGSIKKDKVSDRLVKIRRQLSKKSQWRHHVGSQARIDEETEENHSLDLFDPLESFDRRGGAFESFDRRGGAFNMVGEIDVPDRITLPEDRHADSMIALAGHNEEVFPHHHRVPLSHDTTRRRAVSYDVEFVSDLVSIESESHGSSSGMVEQKSSRKSSKTGEKAFRVHPYHCFDQVPHMTQAQLYQFMLKPSENFDFLQSYVAPSSEATTKIKVSPEIENMYGNTNDGRIGSLRVEVLNCVGLAFTKPDVAVYLICGDVPFATDVIRSCQSPMWPPVSKRAAVFPIHHAYVRLYAGVFATKKEKNDEFAGRVVLDLAAIRPNTEYDVTLPLRVSSFIYDRRPRGVIRIRFSCHWYRERTALLSYLKTPHSLYPSLYEDNPSILCGDPKTFRNVAMTVHGQDLPGKFSRRAFQATMREFNLMRMNLIFMVKTLLVEAVMYEKPLLSLYLFFSWMYCCRINSVSLAPAFFVGFLIFNLVDNYERYSTSEANHLGYEPPTIQEILYCLLCNPENGGMHPLLASTKVAKRNQSVRRKLLASGSGSGNISEQMDIDDGEIEPLNHREFPFSEKLEYRRFRVEDAIDASKGSSRNIVSEQHHPYGRFPVYSGDQLDTSEHSAYEDEWELNDSDDFHGDGDNVFTESDDEEDENEEVNVSVNIPDTPGDVRRIPLGPPQDADVKPIKKIPPQVVLARAENSLHKLTASLSYDKVYHSTLAQGRRSSSISDQEFPTQTPPTDSRRRKRRRIPLDDFDKRLGLRTRHPNPVSALTSSFLGPLMRIFRIFIVVVRVVFNIAVWKDPFCSFWVLCLLLLSMVVLVVFPWRAFMFVVGLVCFGPQNILVRRRRMRRAAQDEKDKEANGGMESTSSIHDTLGDSEHSDATEETTGQEASLSGDNKATAPGTKRGLRGKLARMKTRRRLKKQGSGVSDEKDSSFLQTRTPFSAARSHKASKVTLEPREVVVPYTRFRKERFYDWPPDPAASRAAPVMIETNGHVEDMSVYSIRDRDVSPNGLRQRHAIER